MGFIISIAVTLILLLSVTVVLLKPNMKLNGNIETRFFTFAAILFTSGLDVGLIMFPLTEFPVYDTEAVYEFTNPLAMAFGAWGFLVWVLYFLSTFYFCAIEPQLKIFEIPLIKLLYNLMIIATCAFTAFLLLQYLPDYIHALPEWARYLIVAGIILMAIGTSMSVKFIKTLSISSTWLFYGLIVLIFYISHLGLSGLWQNLKLMLDYFPNMHKFASPISDYHQFYLYWWMAWSLMIGQFVSRFVSHLKIWQLFLALLIIPSITIGIWFCVLYGIYTAGIVVSPTIKMIMVGVGVLFVINSLDSLIRLYTDSLDLSVHRLGKINYSLMNFSLLFGLVLLYRHTALKIEWVGLIVIALYIAIAILTWLKRKNLRALTSL